MEKFCRIIDIARENIRKNPSLEKRTIEDIALQYLSSLKDEVEEVKEEVRANNTIYLEDELSDIAWDYACVLARLEEGGYIESAESVLEHGYEKYAQRAPAFLEPTEAHWDAVKKTQKEVLKQRHEALYGNK